MAVTRLDRVGDGSTTIYDISFTLGYLKKEYVYVYLKGSAFTTQLDYAWINSLQIELNSPLPTGVEFSIRRVVPRNMPVNDYEAGAILRESNLDDSFVQSLMILEEVEDGYLPVDGDFLVNDNIDMQGNRVTNSTDAIDLRDLVTLGQMTAVIAQNTLTGAANGSTPKHSVASLEGWTRALFAESATTDNGEPDEVSGSQRLQALHSLFDAHGTTSTLAAGKHAIGSVVCVTDRDLGIFTVNSGGVPNGGAVIDAGNGNTAVLSDNMLFYTLKMWGAKVDGVTYDDTAIIAALGSGKSIIQRGGVCRINGAATVQITANFESADDFKFLLDTQPSGYVFDVVPEYTPIVLNTGDVTVGQFTKYANNIPSLSAYPYHYAVIKSTEQDLVRLGGQVLTKGSVTVVGEDGKLVYPLTATFGSIQSITLTPINTSVRTIDGLTIEVMGDVNTASLIKQSRNNVKFISPRYIQGETTQVIPVRNFIVPHMSYGLEIIDPICEQLSEGRVDYNYVVNGEYFAFTRIYGMQSWEGWAQIDGNYMRDIVVDASTIYRVGGHFSCWDMTLKNSTVVGQEAIAAAGGGELNVNNVVMTPTAISSGPFSVAVIREDYGAEWDGVVNVSDIVIDTRGIDVAKEINGVSAYMSSGVSAHDFGRDLTLPRDINVSGITVLMRPSATTESDILSVRVGSALATLTGGRKIKYPRNIDVGNISLADSNTAKNNEVNSVYISGTVPSAVTDTLLINVNNVNRRDPRNAGLNPYDGGQNPSFDCGNITGLTVNMNVEGCEWLRARYSPSAGRCRINDCLIAAIEGTGRYELPNNQYAASAFSGTWLGAVQGGIIRAYQAADLSYKQIGFPNYVETNWVYCKNLAVEVNGGIRSLTQTTSTVQTGFVNATYFVSP